MPYIRREVRETFDTEIDELIGLVSSKTKGDDWLGASNYIMTRFLMGIALRKEINISYPVLVKLNGIIETMKYEMNVRVTSPYEAMKEQVNGDIPEYALHAASLSLDHSITG